MYLSDMNPQLERMPLVVISSANFLELIALQRASIDASQDEIEGLMTELADSFLIENGMSLEEVKTFQRHFSREPIKCVFPRRLNTRADKQDDEVTHCEQDFYTQFDLRMLLQALKPFNQPNSKGSGDLDQFNEESIVAWFETHVRRLLLVALADRLGLAETAIEADFNRLQQIADQTRDNLAKLGSGEPLQFDERVTNALNWALDRTDIGGNMTANLRNKLNTK